MEQYWVCQHCMSLNRPGAGRCYSCKEKFGSKAVAAGGSAPAPPRPTQPAPRQDLNMGQGPPPYLSKPLAPVPLPTSYTVAAAAAAVASRGPVGPVTVIKRRISSALATRPIVGVRNLGYATATLLFLTLIAAAALVGLSLPAALDLLQRADLAHAWNNLGSGTKNMVEIAAGATAGLGLLALLGFSLFMGLSTHNAPALGADMPMLTPYAAGVGWIRGLWRQLQIAACAIVPAVLAWLGYEIPALLVAIIAVEITVRRLEDPYGWMTGPDRHLPDLYAKLGTEGSMESLTASVWAVCFRVANLLMIVIWLLPALALVANLAAAATGNTPLPGWQSGGIGPIQGIVGAIAGVALLSAAASLILLLPLVLGLVRRQGARHQLVRMGRARSWVGGRAGPGEYASVAPGRPIPPDWDSEDRIIERSPRQSPPEDYEASDLLATLTSRRAASGPGEAATGTGPGAYESPDRFPGRAFESASDQASLNSPSTTSSSFPWSEEPPASPE